MVIERRVAARVAGALMELRVARALPGTGVLKLQD
jgi:hypothetical protein